MAGRKSSRTRSKLARTQGDSPLNTERKEVLDRLCAEFNAGRKKKRVTWVYPGFPKSLVAGSIGHAGAAEASLLSASWPGCVDVSRLPSRGKLKSTAFAIVDGETFDCQPTRDHTVREKQDPRRHTDPACGERLISRAVKEVVRDVKKDLLA
jgi:creatinine amidohydrolase/Fe(II)-dependent formamide hydrolase-like protein